MSQSSLKNEYKPTRPGQVNMKVINLGLGRTGTLSFREALTILGFGPVYHFTDLREHNFREQPNWHNVHRRINSAENFDIIYKGYNSACDYPTAIYPEQLLAAYPEARYILTTRDPEKWHKSVMGTIKVAADRFRWLSFVHPQFNRIFSWADEVFFGPTGYHPNFEDAGVEQMLNHNAKVQALIPSKQLLVFDVKQGWKPLCEFLDVPVPNVPFPHVNDAAEFRRLTWTLYIVTVFWWLIAVSAGSGLILLLCNRVLGLDALF